MNHIKSVVFGIDIMYRVYINIDDESVPNILESNKKIMIYESIGVIFGYTF